MENLRSISAIRIKEEINTEGSAPLYVTGDDDKEYYAKPIRTSPPCLEIINEFFCSYLLECWGFNSPEICLINIDYELTEGKKLSSRYKEEYFTKPFFASKSIGTHIEIENYFKSFSKSDLNRFATPADIIRIGYFDLWIGNKDRKPKNPNIILSYQEGKFVIHPIDHGAAFCYLKHTEVSDIRLRLEDNASILTTQMAKTTAKELLKDNIDSFWENEILNYLLISEEKIDLIFDEVPQFLGFSKRSKEHLKKFLFDKKRNAELWQRALYFLG